MMKTILYVDNLTKKIRRREIIKSGTFGKGLKMSC